VQWFVCLNRVCGISMWHNHPCTQILFSDCIYICTCDIHMGSTCHVTSMRSLLHVTSKCVIICTCDMSMRSTRHITSMRSERHVASKKSTRHVTSNCVFTFACVMYTRDLHVTLHQTVSLAHAHCLPLSVSPHPSCLSTSLSLLGVDQYHQCWTRCCLVNGQGRS